MKLLTFTFLLCALLPALADTPPAKALQMRFMAPTSVQEDLIGNVKSLEKVTYKDGQLENRSLDTYTSTGCALEKSTWDKTGTLKGHVVFSYDDDGTWLKQETLDANNQVIISTTVEIDVTGKKITSTTKRADGTVQGKTITQYDGYGKEGEVFDYDADGKLTERTTMERNNFGKETTITFYGKKNEITNVITMRWNPDGTPAKQSFPINTDGVVCDKTFEYTSLDAKGNWTSRIEKMVFGKRGEKVSEAESSVQRKITYY